MAIITKIRNANKSTTGGGRRLLVFWWFHNKFCRFKVKLEWAFGSVEQWGNLMLVMKTCFNRSSRKKVKFIETALARSLLSLLILPLALGECAWWMVNISWITNEMLHIAIVGWNVNIGRWLLYFIRHSHRPTTHAKLCCAMMRGVNPILQFWACEYFATGNYPLVSLRIYFRWTFHES